MARQKVIKGNKTELPYNLQAEQACLGSALMHKESLNKVLSRLDEDDFYDGRHQIIYRVLTNLNDKHIDVDILTAMEEIANLKEEEHIGGPEYLQACCDQMVALSSIDFYIDIVKDQSVLRKFLIAIRTIDADYRQGEIEDLDNFIVQAETKIKEATEKRRIGNFRGVQEIAKEVIKDIDTVRAANGNNLTGLTSGYKNIDDITKGFRKSELTIIAARPALGKTALALNFAYNVASKEKAPVAIFSLEMASELLVKRLVASCSNVPLENIASGVLNSTQKTQVAGAIREISSLPIYIDDSPGIRLMDILAKSRQLQATLESNKQQLGMIIIDYLGLVTIGSNSKNPDSRNEEVRKISLALKGLARELKVPVIVVSQLSRDVEKRDNKRPMMSDLRDSGSIEQDADVIMLLYREDYYSQYKKDEGAAGDKKVKAMSSSQKLELSEAVQRKQLLDQMPGSASYVEVQVAKNRNGQTGRACLFFFKSFGRFTQPSEEWELKMRDIANKSSNVD